MEDAPDTDRTPTATRILDTAQDLVQRRGYNAVSYGDLADELDLTTTAIHYHFPAKADLGQALVRRYRRQSSQTRAALEDQHENLRERLVQYVELFSGILENGGLCLCGILAADTETLPDKVQREIQRFFAEQEDWLTTIIGADSSGDAGLQGCPSPRATARVLLAAVEGAMLTTPQRDPETYTDTLRRLIDSIVT
ncbi:TetR/AcrR family transcriptional regulator [Salinibacter sp.]|uniref:TetR/AcrR family transcriptional regulator n=1 Tax=Salinibacter sp. TaxID=2065818 RepID=UPI0021E886E5|nr:TetR/AcrR family transcriptional regulator [Salinibacter sp.]